VDLFVRSEHLSCRDLEGTTHLTLALGTKLPAQDIQALTGGGGCNTSVGLARLGCQAALCSVVGDDAWGQLLLNVTRQNGVDTSPITILSGESSSVSAILVAPCGERVILHTHGTTAHLGEPLLSKQAIETADVIYLNRLHDHSQDILTDIAHLLTARPDTFLTWNPGGSQITAGHRTDAHRNLLARCTLLLLNREEALTFTGARDVAHAEALLLQAGVHTVCITDGPHGAVAARSGERWHCPSLGRPVVDTTGAGDAFGTAVTWALASGQDLPFALQAGTMNAASVVGLFGAQSGLLTDTQITSWLQDFPLDVRRSTPSSHVERRPHPSPGTP
jgi:ribokinase